MSLDKLREMHEKSSLQELCLLDVLLWLYNQYPNTTEKDNSVDARLIVASRNLLPAFLEFAEHCRDYWGIQQRIRFKKLEQAIERELGTTPSSK